MCRMKSLAFLLAAFLLAHSSIGAAQGRTILAVMDIQDNSGKLRTSDLRTATDFLRGLLLKADRFEVVDKSRQEEKRRAVIDDLQRESGDSCYDEKCRIHLGRELAADTLLTCAVGALGSRCMLTCELIPLEKATAERAGVARFKCGADGLADAVESVAAQLIGTPKPIHEPLTMPSLPTPEGNVTIEWAHSSPAALEFAKTETTVAQYLACVRAGICDEEHFKTSSDLKYCNVGYADRGDHPMNCIDWYGATQFCEWAGGRLPTEGEWHAEASADGVRAYPWGSGSPNCSLGVIDDGGAGCGRDRTWAVCSRAEGNSLSGLCDMTGNVWEWTSTPKGADSVVRGASWDYVYSPKLRSSPRFWQPRDRRLRDVGVRCVRPVNP